MTAEKIKTATTGSIKKAAVAVTKAVKKALTPAPTPDVAVRYEADKKAWAVLDDQNNILETFTHGVMTNVKFITREVSTYVAAERDCGGTNHKSSFGLAVGQLKKNTHGRHSTGFQNLEYKNNAFANAEGAPLASASIVRLMHDRKSLFRP